jgi:hypothetical protein
LYWHSGSHFVQSRKIMPLQNCSRDEDRGYRGRRWIIGRRRAVTRTSQQAHGRLDVDRVLDCAAERAGDLALDMQEEFDIPLPPSIEGSAQIP